MRINEKTSCKEDGYFMCKSALRPEEAGFLDKTIVVIPCYNEAGRLREDEFNLLLNQPGLEILFVNDGSKDQTEQHLKDFMRKTEQRVDLLNFKVNSGKAEAVRQGMLHSIKSGASMVGFIDADMATPAGEVLRLIDKTREQKYQVILGSRVKLLGTDINRHATRHYFGRVFATAASLILHLPVYDTQCGAKFFRVTPLLKEVLTEPFSSRWFFDIELIGRLLIGSKAAQPLTIDDFIEVPLKKWTDVGGSKIKPLDVIKVPAELLKIALKLNRRRQKAQA